MVQNTKVELQIIEELEDDRYPDKREDILFKTSHVNHPCNVWVRESKSNYRLMYKIYMACLAEYTFRYGKIHGSIKTIFVFVKNT